MSITIAKHLESLQLIAVYNTQSPFWVNVSASIGDEQITDCLRIDWNHKQTVGHFAAFANQVIRSGGTVTTEAIK